MNQAQCKEKNCANKGVTYYLPKEVTIVECGGCKAILEAQPSDVEAPPVLELPF